MKSKFRNALLACAAATMVGGIGAGIALSNKTAVSVFADAAHTKFDDVTSGKKYFITAQANDTEYVLKAGGFAAKGSGAYTSVFNPANVEESEAWLFTFADGVWDISATINDTTYHLGVTKDNNGLTSFETQSYGAWSMTASGDDYVKLSAPSSGDTRKLSLYATTPNWRCYTGSSGVQDIKLYEWVAPSKTVSSLEITSGPTKTAYEEGEALDLAGLVVTAHWSDSTSSVVTDLATYSITEGTLLSVSDTTVIVTYGGKSAEINLTVSPVAFVSTDMYLTAEGLGMINSYGSTDLAFEYGGKNFFFGRTDLLKNKDTSAIQLKASTGALFNKSRFALPIGKITFMADRSNANSPSNWAVYGSADTAGDKSNAFEIETVDASNRIYSVDLSGAGCYFFTLAKTGSFACYFDMIVIELEHSDDDVAAVRGAASAMLETFADFCQAQQGPSVEQWNAIAGAYKDLSDDQKAIFDEVVLNDPAKPEETVPVQATDLQKAVQKIEYCVSHYGVENFTSREINPAKIATNHISSANITLYSMIALLGIGIAAGAGMMVVAKKRKRA